MKIKESALILDCPKAESKILAFIRKTVADSGREGVVLGLSGGIDSAVVGALCVRALGMERVVAVLMPASHTPAEDINDARKMAKSWGIKSFEVPIDGTLEALSSSLPRGSDDRMSEANTKARIRMVILYRFANSLGMLVAGTGDKSEEQIGFFTKFGDGGVDFLPIAHLYKTQVRQLGTHLGIPQNVVTKPASPQLWPGHRAIDELPLDYDKLDLVLYGLIDAKLSPKEVAAQTGVDVGIVERVEKMHRSSEHKRRVPPMLETRPGRKTNPL